MTAPHGETYLTVEYPGGVMGIVRHGPRLLLSDDLKRGSGAVLDDCRSAMLGLPGDYRAEGGRLPPGAVTAIVTDDAGLRRSAATGGRAWAIVLDQHCDGRPSPVCFRDADGALVVPPLPAQWSRSPILEAEATCPACDLVGVDGSARWDVVQATDESRGASGPDMEPVPFIVCRNCGYEHSAGGWFVSTVGGAHDDAEHARLAAQGAARRRRQARAHLANLHFPVYGARGWPVGPGGWSASGGEDTEWETISVTVDHGSPDRAGPSLSVETSKERSQFATDVARARSMLAPIIGEPFPGGPDRSPRWLATWMHIRERENLRLATLAPAVDRTILIDGIPTQFVVVSVGDRWTAAGRHGAWQIALVGHDVDLDAVELTALEDPVRELREP